MIKRIAQICFIFFISTGVVAQIKMKKLIDLPNEISETSGLILYQKKYLITHNDGGNKSELFVLDLNGNLLKTIDIEDTKNRDWEDLAQDDEGRVYIGDFGNNNNEREKCYIYILPKNFIDKKEVEPEKITFEYEDQKDYPPKKSKLNYDCEAFIWKDGKLYLFTKCRTKPFTGETRIYELDPDDDKQEAKYKGSIFLCQIGWKFCSVTSADYNPKTNTLALLTYSKLYILTNFKETDFWNGDIRSYSLPIVKQREGVCFNGKDGMYLTDEHRKGLGGGNLYQIEFK